MKQPTHSISLGRRRVDLFREEPITDPPGASGTRAVKSGEREGEVFMQIDTRQLAEFCRRALNAKGRRCRLAGGAIEFVVQPGSVKETTDAE